MPKKMNTKKGTALNVFQSLPTYAIKMINMYFRNELKYNEYAI